MPDTCPECRLLQDRVTQHRRDLQAADRLAMWSGGAEERRAAGLTAQRLHRAQGYLREHRNRKH